jgi:hypothetical protein
MIGMAIIAFATLIVVGAPLYAIFAGLSWLGVDWRSAALSDHEVFVELAGRTWGLWGPFAAYVFSRAVGQALPELIAAAEPRAPDGMR